MPPRRLLVPLALALNLALALPVALVAPGAVEAAAPRAAGGPVDLVDTVTPGSLDVTPDATTTVSAAASDTEFFLGRHVLVAPALEAGATSVPVTLPPDRWVHLFTGRGYAGDRTVTVPAPIGRPAAFVREGGPWSTRLPARFRAAGLTALGSGA